MRTKGRACLAVASLLLAAAPAAAQLAALRFDSSKVPVGRVYQYLKSNRDGSHPGRVTVYVAGLDRLESLKWDDEIGWATFVVAEMDWKRFSVRRFESWDLRRGKHPMLKATLDTDQDGAVSVSVLPGPPVKISVWPWHSYDFDFASLGASLPHRVDPEAEFRFSRTDFVQEEGNVRFAELGEVRLRYEGRELRGETKTRRYRLEGHGLSNTVGTLWADAAEGHLVEFELPIPDEPGFTDGRLRLLGIERKAPEEWGSFKRARLGE